MRWHPLENALESLIVSSIKSLSVWLDRALEYVVEVFGDIMRLPVPISLHHISQMERRASMSTSPVKKVGVVTLSLVIVGCLAGSGSSLLSCYLFSAGSFSKCPLEVELKVA